MTEIDETEVDRQLLAVGRFDHLCELPRQCHPYGWSYGWCMDDMLTFVKSGSSLQRSPAPRADNFSDGRPSADSAHEPGRRWWLDGA